MTCDNRCSLSVEQCLKTGKIPLVRGIACRRWGFDDSRPTMQRGSSKFSEGRATINLAPDKAAPRHVTPWNAPLCPAPDESVPALSNSIFIHIANSRVKRIGNILSWLGNVFGMARRNLPLPKFFAYKTLG